MHLFESLVDYELSQVILQAENEEELIGLLHVGL